MQGENCWVDRELSEIVENLLILQFGQGTRLVHRPLTQSHTRAAGHAAQTDDEDDPGVVHGHSGTGELLRVGRSPFQRPDGNGIQPPGQEDGRPLG